MFEFCIIDEMLALVMILLTASKILLEEAHEDVPVDTYKVREHKHKDY